MFRGRVLILLAPEGDSTTFQVPSQENIQSMAAVAAAALQILHKWNDVDLAYIFTRDNILKQRLCSGFCSIGRRFAAALLPRLFGRNPRSHHKGATGRVRTGDQRLPALCHCQLRQDIPTTCCNAPALSEGYVYSFVRRNNAECRKIHQDTAFTCNAQ